MRFPVFGRGANPRIDRPIQRKKMAYLEELVRMGNSDWVDPDDHKRGIVAREIIYFGARPVKVEPADLSKLPLLELPGIKFVPPAPLTGDGNILSEQIAQWQTA